MGSRLIRVLHCPADVAGHASGLTRAERELGLDSRLLVLDRGGVGRELQRARLVLQAFAWAQVVHFNFGSSLFPRWYPAELTRGGLKRVPAALGRVLELRDLPLLRRAGKRVFVTFQGDDARTRDHARHGADVTYFDDGLDARKRAAVGRFDRYADAIFTLNPDLLALLPPHAQFLPYASVDLDDWRPVPPAGEGVLRVVHAPSDRAVKGTEVVIAAVERLRSEGVPIELDVVEGLTRAQARRRYERADVLVDQLRVGWYGGAAVELMALGKPVIAYIADEDLARAPAELRDELPIVRATVDTVRDVLQSLATERRSELPDIGRRSRAFVERRHDPRRVAETTKAAYERARLGSIARS